MRILFVCTANLCRSPLAEHLFRRIIAGRRLESVVAVASAGVFAADGVPALAATQRVGRAHGLDLSAHRSRPVVPAALTPDHHVLVMEEIHRRQILAAARLDPQRVRLLGRFAPGMPVEIEDPVGGPDEAYERCVLHLEAALARLATWLEEEKISRP